MLPRPSSSRPALLLCKELLLVEHAGLVRGGVERGHHHVRGEPWGVAGGALDLLVRPEDGGCLGSGQRGGLGYLHRV